MPEEAAKLLHYCLIYSIFILQDESALRRMHHAKAESLGAAAQYNDNAVDTVVSNCVTSFSRGKYAFGQLCGGRRLLRGFFILPEM